MTLTPEVMRTALARIRETLERSVPFDGFEDDGQVIWLKRGGYVAGCMNRTQFYEIVNGIPSPSQQVDNLSDL